MSRKLTVKHEMPSCCGSKKPRTGPICDLMKGTRARFKRCLRHCKSNENRIRADCIAKKLLAKDNISFWKYVTKMNRTCHNVLASTVNNVSGEKNITSLS